ncbi:hypothetical protein L226DRAFT_610713 [Lentinus tigrinus ALCF2SS1-7]|uniref:uncharacterized protein n=1 Tax=Lentinus tigrinus ALCF2SS1-7 TaxID=1328758 RepID=UPI0011662B62|nr:hypothetical protein L226DRAFT_610713 [Lentinus tigrinus ALCF2SS1-7]
MKLITTLVTALCATLAAAQNAWIVAPPPMATFAPGDDIVVQVNKPNSLTNSRDVSVAIGLLSCVGRAPPMTCEGINSAWMFGDILYAGPYDPTIDYPYGGRYQNFTVTVPEDFQPGPAVLASGHYVLIGALFWPNLDISNETVFISS